jgi:uncharacterized protein (DUF1697 family)
VRFIGFLRGANVGGRGSISMATLRTSVESLGYPDVRTVINSGNVIFSAPSSKPEALAAAIERAIEAATGLPLSVLVLTQARLRTIVEAIPSSWRNDRLTKCDVMFLWRDIDDAKVLNQLPSQPDLDEVRYTPGAVVWRVDRSNAKRSRMSRITGAPISKQMTIRNANTVRRILDSTME